MQKGVENARSHVVVSMVGCFHHSGKNCDTKMHTKTFVEKFLNSSKMFYSLALQTITWNVTISAAIVFNVEVLLLIDHQTVYLIRPFYIFIYIFDIS